MEWITVFLGVSLAIALFFLFRKPAPMVEAAAPASRLPASEAKDQSARIDALRDDLSRARAELTKVRQDADRKENELRQLRDDNKSGKQKTADRLKSLEKDKESLTSQLQDLKRRQQGLVSAEESREKMLLLEKRAAELEAELSDVRARRGSAPAVVVAPPVVLPERTGDASEAEDALRRELQRLKVLLREQAREMKESFNSQVRSERDKFREETESLRKRLRKSLTEFDRERRRADNTDRAYMVLRGQLESALDRLAAADKSVRRPDAIDPDQLRAELDARRAARSAEKAVRTATPEQVATTEPVVESGGEIETPAVATVVESTEVAAAEQVEPMVSAVETSERGSAVEAAPAAEPTPAAAAPESARASLDAIDDDGWFDDEVQAKLTGDFKTV
jgi:hypothetical protein